jgi:hypothetical protein
MEKIIRAFGLGDPHIDTEIRWLLREVGNPAFEIGLIKVDSDYREWVTDCPEFYSLPKDIRLEFEAEVKKRIIELLRDMMINEGGVG